LQAVGRAAPAPFSARRRRRPAPPPSPRHRSGVAADEDLAAPQPPGSDTWMTQVRCFPFQTFEGARAAPEGRLAFGVAPPQGTARRLRPGLHGFQMPGPTLQPAPALVLAARRHCPLAPANPRPPAARGPPPSPPTPRPPLKNARPPHPARGRSTRSGRRRPPAGGRTLLAALWSTSDPLPRRIAFHPALRSPCRMRPGPRARSGGAAQAAALDRLHLDRKAARAFLGTLWQRPAGRRRAHAGRGGRSARDGRCHPRRAAIGVAKKRS
jgi:hypothetical protein